MHLGLPELLHVCEGAHTNPPAQLALKPPQIPFEQSLLKHGWPLAQVAPAPPQMPPKHTEPSPHTTVSGEHGRPIALPAEAEAAGASAV